MDLRARDIRMMVKKVELFQSETEMNNYAWNAVCETQGG